MGSSLQPLATIKFQIHSSKNLKLLHEETQVIFEGTASQQDSSIRMST